MTAPDRRRLLGAVAWGTLAAPWPAAWAAPPAPGDAVQWPQVHLLDGAIWDASQTQGKAVVAVFWSTTCPFCRRHNAHVDKLRQAAAGRPLEVVTIARETDPQVVRRYLDKQGWQFAVTLDQAAMRAALSHRNMIPLTVTVDRQGRLKQVIPGEMFEEDVLDLIKLAG
jgi:thiol-disulfide isomerase/thioredoxin